MPYILNKTNGTVLTVVTDAGVDLTTDLIFLGKNYAGYGEVQNENFLKLLENFSNNTPPSKAIEGQIWYDSVNRRLNVYDNVYWKPVASLEISSEDNSPQINKNPSRGDLWYNTDTGQLNIFDGSEYFIIGPQTGSDLRAQWKGDFEFPSPDLKDYNIKAVLGSTEEVVAIVSGKSYTLDDYNNSSTLPKYPTRTGTFTKVAKGITLVGANPVTGSSRKEETGLTEDLYFWGTAAESLKALYATTATYTTSVAYSTYPANESTDIYLVPFVSEANFGNSGFYVDSDSTGLKYQPSSGILFTIASSAQYADIAERYHADAYYEPGTVLIIGGKKEVTTTNKRANISVAGVVSSNPAYRMNEKAGDDVTHPLIALKGRVPCKVVGPIEKGDLLVSSYVSGHAERAIATDSPCAIIGIALEDFNGQTGIIEIKV